MEYFALSFSFLPSQEQTLFKGDNVYWEIDPENLDMSNVEYIPNKCNTWLLTLFSLYPAC